MKWIRGPNLCGCCFPLLTLLYSMSICSLLYTLCVYIGMFPRAVGCVCFLSVVFLGCCPALSKVGSVDVCHLRVHDFWSSVAWLLTVRLLFYLGCISMCRVTYTCCLSCRSAGRVLKVHYTCLVVARTV